MNMKTGFVIPVLFTTILAGCQTAPGKPVPVSKTATDSPQKAATLQLQAQDNNELEKVRRAYETYLNDADIEEGARLDALSRLAEIEYQLQGPSVKPDHTGSEDETPQQRAQRQQLERTI